MFLFIFKKHIFSSISNDKKLSYIYIILIKTFKIHLTTRGVANFDILADFRLPHKCFRMSILYFHVEQLTFDFKGKDNVRQFNNLVNGLKLDYHFNPIFSNMTTRPQFIRCPRSRFSSIQNSLMVFCFKFWKIKILYTLSYAYFNGSLWT